MMAGDTGTLTTAPGLKLLFGISQIDIVLKKDLVAMMELHKSCYLSAQSQTCKHIIVFVFRKLLQDGRREAKCKSQRS